MQQDPKLTKEEQERVDLERSAALVTLSEYPEFPVFLEMLDGIADALILPPEHLMSMHPTMPGVILTNEALVHQNAGGRANIMFVKNAFIDAKRFIDRKAKENTDKELASENKDVV